MKIDPCRHLSVRSSLDKSGQNVLEGRSKSRTMQVVGKRNITTWEGFMQEGRGSRGYKRCDTSLQWCAIDGEVKCPGKMRN